MGRISLGLDMSSTKSGYALFNDDKLITYGLWEPSKELSWQERILYMGDKLNEFLIEHNVDIIYCEDVPLMLKNPQTLKILCALQGVLMGICLANKVEVKFISVSTWRSMLGLFDKTQKGKERDEMKRKSIEMANNIFGLDLIYKSASSKFNQEDEADSILIVYSQILFQ